MDLPGRISNLQELLRSSDAIEAERSRLVARLSAADEALDVVRHETGASLPPDFGAAVHLLKAALRSAERRRAAALEAERDIEGIDQERAALAGRVAIVTGELRGLEQACRLLGDGELAAGLLAIRTRRQALVLGSPASSRARSRIWRLSAVRSRPHRRPSRLGYTNRIPSTSSKRGSRRSRRRWRSCSGGFGRSNRRWAT